jgi:hypothetical protein
MRRSHIGDVLAAVALGMALVPARASAETIDELKRELESMKQLMRSMQQRLERQEATIKRLEARTPAADKTKKVAAAPARPAPDAARALDEAVAQVETKQPPAPAAPAAREPALLSAQAGGTTFRLIDVSFDILTAAGTSTADDDEIAVLQGGGHDPKRRGFTLQQGELSLAGAVDPYFTGQAHVVFTDEVIELEEAFLTTQRLPYGLQVKAGHFLTEFGRINPMHPHAWQWIDQPVINTRLLGPDGLRNPGFRLAWLLPIPWFSQIQLGAQDASGETAVSFLGEGEGAHDHGHEEEEEEELVGIGGRPIVERSVHDLGDLLYLARWEHGFALTSSVEAKLGGSALFGPNASGPHGQTRIYGGDAVVKWRPSDNFRGWPFLSWETEVMARDFDADAVRRADLALPSTTLHDWGLYTQLLYGFAYRWAAGVRYEYATGSGASVGGRAADPFRDDRHRVAPLLSWRPTEFSRLRLQYNFDHAQHLDDDAHSVWFGVEILYGAHPAHNF